MARRHRRRPSILTILFSVICLALISIIAYQALQLSKRGLDAEEPEESNQVSEETLETIDESIEEPDGTLDPNRIIMDFSTVVEASGTEYLDRWPGESSVESLRDTSAFVASLVGKEKSSTALEGVTIILDPGHGGIDGGTVYPANPPHEIIEKDIVLPLSLEVKAGLEALGANVVMTRDTDEWLSVYSRVAFAGEYLVDQLIDELQSTEKTLDPLYELKEKFQTVYDLNIDVGGGDFMGGGGSNEDARLLYDLGRQFPEVLFVSLHVNSWSDPTVGGLQVYYLDNAFQFSFTKSQTSSGDILPPVYQNYDDEMRLKLATTFASTILEQVPDFQTVGGPDTLKQEGFVVLNRTGLNAVMLELGYVTNAKDRANLLDPAFRNTLASSITEGIYRYYCMP